MHGTSAPLSAESSADRSVLPLVGLDRGRVSERPASNAGDAIDDYARAHRRLHGNSGPRKKAKDLRRRLIGHCGGRPSATQLAMIEQAAMLQLRIAVMDEDFISTGRRSAHATRDYLAWANSLTRLMARLGLKGSEHEAVDPVKRLHAYCDLPEAERLRIGDAMAAAGGAR